MFLSVSVLFSVILAMAWCILHSTLTRALFIRERTQAQDREPHLYNLQKKTLKGIGMSKSYHYWTSVEISRQRFEFFSHGYNQLGGDSAVISKQGFEFFSWLQLTRRRMYGVVIKGIFRMIKLTAWLIKYSTEKSHKIVPSWQIMTKI